MRPARQDATALSLHVRVPFTQAVSHASGMHVVGHRSIVCHVPASSQRWRSSPLQRVSPGLQVPTQAPSLHAKAHVSRGCARPRASQCTTIAPRHCDTFAGQEVDTAASATAASATGIASVEMHKRLMQSPQSPASGSQSLLQRLSLQSDESGQSESSTQALYSRSTHAGPPRVSIQTAP
jgi:hypothetical protein